MGKYKFSLFIAVNGSLSKYNKPTSPEKKKKYGKTYKE